MIYGRVNVNGETRQRRETDMLPFRCSVALRELLKPKRTRPLFCGTARDETSRAARDNVTPATDARAPAGGCRRYLCTSDGQPKNCKDAANEK